MSNIASDHTSLIVRKVALFGLFGIGNFGNEATLKTTLDQLKERVPRSIPLVICPNPEATVATYGVKAINWNPGIFLDEQSKQRPRIIRLLTKPFNLLAAIWQIRRRIYSCDYFIVPGTGVLDDYALSDYTMPLTLLVWCVTARLLRIPVIFASVGAGPIKDPHSRKLMKLIAWIATQRSYRDEYSKRFIRELGVDTRNDLVLPDLAFAHAHPFGPASRDHGASTGLTVGLGMMSYHGWSGNVVHGQPIYEAYLDKMAVFAGQLLKEGFSLRFLIGKASDNRAVDDLLARLPGAGTNDRVRRNSMENMDQLLAEIDQTDVVVATRFHNVVAALLLGRPTVSIGYSEKNDEVMESCGLGGFCQSIEALDVSKLLQQFNLVVKNRVEIHRSLREKVRRHQVALRNYFDDLFGGPGF